MTFKAVLEQPLASLDARYARQPYVQKDYLIVFAPARPLRVGVHLLQGLKT